MTKRVVIPDEATQAAAEMIAGIEQTDWERWEDIAEHALRAALPHLTALAVTPNDDLWQAALSLARSRGEHLSDIIRNALTTYIDTWGNK